MWLSLHQQICIWNIKDWNQGGMWSWWCHNKLTWSCTSTSHSSRQSRFSNGLNNASLKWKWGNSTCSFSTAVTVSWIQATAFFEIARSLWQAACKTKPIIWNTSYCYYLEGSWFYFFIYWLILELFNNTFSNAKVIPH